MPYAALATDYDGTIAHGGTVDPPTLAALSRLRAAGWRLVLVTGRELDDVRRLMPGLPLFDRVVAENGAVLHAPASGAVRLLASLPPPGFAARLLAAGVRPLQTGRVIVATWQEHEARVLGVIHELGLDLCLIRNNGALMILPRGVDKRSGTAAALADLGIAPCRCVGVGDAENDLDLLALCGLPVAVANALPVIKQAAKLVTRGECGEGVAELAEYLLHEHLLPPVPEA